ncbi:phosphatase PAP2 family protein [Sediminibacter sp. Hel_I_10]|uniref:phosphatase PAP2 family protein n=1 Tax=Sediminibacter sp. Hel_I_10 TaxID=1392490 RepID=UPI0004789B79|nr:phosphatase PAP2 family protein [Sediminibacter sp. Hel_I_10]
MKLAFLLFGIALLFGHLHITAQNLDPSKPSDTSSYWQLIKYDAQYTLKSVGHGFSRPLYWKGKDYAKMGILFAGTAAMTLADDPVRDFVSNGKKNVPEVLRDFGWYFGSPQNYFLANAGLYGFGVLTKNEKIRKTSVLIISSSITTGLMQTFLKNAVGRQRPNANDDNLNFSPFSKSGAFHSFPSGHTVLSITMAHAIAKQFDNIWIKAGVYAIGAIPPASRLIDDAHWISDVAFSAALSIIVVDSMDKFLFNENAYSYPQKKKSVSWNFCFGANTIGIVGTF